MNKCLLVGLGQMGWRYDADSEGVLTHAKAIKESKKLTLTAAVDPSEQARKEFSQLYPQVETFASIQEAQAVGPFDWIFLTLPTQFHLAAFNQALELKPHVIVCEKPLAPSSLEAEDMAARARAQDCLLLVNYIRPHEPHCRKMFDFIKQNNWGTVQKIIVRYGKGVANSASHFIQLLIQEFGTPSVVRLINQNNTNLADPEPDFILEFPHASAWFLRFDYQCYALSEMDIYLEQGAIFYRAMGQQIDYQQALPDVLFPSVRRLQSVGSHTTELMQYQRHALATYLAIWEGKLTLDTLTQSAIQAIIVIEQLTELMKSQAKGLG